MPLILWLATKTGLSRRLVVVLLIVAAAGGTVGLWKLWLHFHDKHVVEQHDTARDNAILKKELPAVQNSAEQRATDTVTTEQQREELRHADTPPASGAPSGDGLAPRQRRGCIILRQQGQRLADHPPCQRLKG